ncbi:5-formyltetrahydrofolate cyclo-ligase [Halobacteriovorax marinus]|uniref:5-formyltetrahydrofolate cyclo-ligase n=1 Tax=Halobacteriovorax marinus TaxID=97084 RepID=A0A1Y5F924_9BACT|nr:5-formyltetrahydrofolate cyclo-ligase [Halobacteriovorax marinus]
MKDILSSTDSEHKKLRAKDCATQLFDLFHSEKLLSDKCILGTFAPMQDELDLMTGILEWRDNLAFPSVNKAGEMVFRKAAFKNLVVSKYFGVEILGPELDSEEVVPDVLLIPGLAFGKRGERLGRGRGHYDKYLKNYKGITIGLGLVEQIVDGIEMEEHDCFLNWIVTDEEVIKV